MHIFTQYVLLELKQIMVKELAVAPSVATGVGVCLLVLVPFPRTSEGAQACPKSYSMIHIKNKRNILPLCPKKCDSDPGRVTRQAVRSGTFA